MQNFTLQDTAADIQAFKGILDTTLGDITTWDERSGNREQDWTTHQVLAHIVSVARLLNLAVDAALEQRQLYMPGFERREDLRDWNAAQIAALQPSAPDTLREELLAELDKAAHHATSISEQRAAQAVMVRVYNRPSPVRNLIDWQLSHAGIVHGAQITRAAGKPPLWAHMDAAFTHRQIARFLSHFSWAYWHTHTPGLHSAINFRVEGEGGGVWHLLAAPDGGSTGPGALDDADYTLTFARPKVLFGVFTRALSMKDVLSSGQMKADGDLRAVLELLKLFSPSPPS